MGSVVPDRLRGGGPLVPEDEPTGRAAALASVIRAAWLVAGGLAIAIAFLDPRAWPVAWLALVPLFSLAPSAASAGTAAREGLWMGLATNVPAFWWLVETIHRFGGFPFPVALLFYAILSLFGAGQFALVAVLLQRAGARAPILFAPALWTAIEFLYPNLFPWRIAHSQRAILPLVQIGEITGPYGLSFAMAWLGCAASRFPWSARRLLPPVAAISLLFWWGTLRIGVVDEEIARAPAYSIGVVQGNVGLGEKRHAERFESNVERYRRLSLDLPRTPDLLVWPETVVEWGLPRTGGMPPGTDAFPGAPTALLFGAVSYQPLAHGTRWYNSAYVRRKDGGLQGPYDKFVLMPFGEFIPLASIFPHLKELSPQTGDFAAGDGPVVLDAGNGARVGPLICYEDLLAGHVRRTVEAGATLLATLANDAWFGDTAALRQHESLALWRAVENRRYLVRATNTGLTAVIDPVGRSVLELPIERQSAAIADARLLDAPTPYQRVGDLFAWASAALAVGLLTGRRRPGQSPRRSGARSSSGPTTEGPGRNGRSGNRRAGRGPLNLTRSAADSMTAG